VENAQQIPLKALFKRNMFVRTKHDQTLFVEQVDNVLIGQTILNMFDLIVQTNEMF